ncbi:Wzz/FepE/Etk N-terminal domain-containing protein [Bacillus sp. JJ664]
MEETVGIREFYAILKKRFWVIILAIILTSTLSSYYSFYYMQPTYEASSQILVNEKKADEVNAQFIDIQTNLQLINTYNVILTSPAILTKVIERLDLDISVEELQNMITVGSENESQVMNVVVKNKDPELVIKMANTIADVAKEQIPKIMSINNVSILTKTDLNKELSPVQLTPMLIIAIANVVGILISVCIVFLLHYLDNTIKDEKQLESILGVPILGTVYDSGKERKNRSNRGVQVVATEEKKQAYS